MPRTLPLMTPHRRSVNRTTRLRCSRDHLHPLRSRRTHHRRNRHRARRIHVVLRRRGGRAPRGRCHARAGRIRTVGTDGDFRGRHHRAVRAVSTTHHLGVVDTGRRHARRGRDLLSRGMAGGGGRVSGRGCADPRDRSDPGARRADRPDSDVDDTILRSGGRHRDRHSALHRHNGLPECPRCRGAEVIRIRNTLAGIDVRYRCGDGDRGAVRRPRDQSGRSLGRTGRRRRGRRGPLAALDRRGCPAASATSSWRSCRACW